jgi:long-chain acyl-CoA synthetase
VGDKKPYVTALLTLNPGNQPKPQQSAGKPAEPSGATENRPLHQAVKEAVARVNKQLADFERIRRFKVLARDFSIEHGELTPTMKIRRSRVLELHKDLVSELYLGREESE